jgi:hypothetical protein
MCYAQCAGAGDFRRRYDSGYTTGVPLRNGRHGVFQALVGGVSLPSPRSGRGSGSSSSSSSRHQQRA